VWWRFRWVGFPFSLRLEQGQCNDPDCPPPDHHHQFWPCRFSRPTWASLHWPFRCVRVRVGGRSSVACLRSTCAHRSSSLHGRLHAGVQEMVSQHEVLTEPFPSLGSHGGSDRDVRVNGASRGRE